MLLTLTAVSWAVLAYVFRAQIPVVVAAVKADYAWVKSFFVKPLAPVPAPAPTPAPTAPAAPAAGVAPKA